MTLRTLRLEQTLRPAGRVHNSGHFYPDCLTASRWLRLLWTPSRLFTDAFTQGLGDMRDQVSRGRSIVRFR